MANRYNALWQVHEQYMYLHTHNKALLDQSGQSMVKGYVNQHCIHLCFSVSSKKYMYIVYAFEVSHTAKCLSIKIKGRWYM